jgi:oligopeptide transport system substrate-binding protein
VQLEYPMPYLPGVLKHYTAFPLPRHTIEKFGNDWTKPENLVVNGPTRSPNGARAISSAP